MSIHAGLPIPFSMTSSTPQPLLFRLVSALWLGKFVFPRTGTHRKFASPVKKVGTSTVYSCLHVEKRSMVTRTTFALREDARTAQENSTSFPEVTA